MAHILIIDDDQTLCEMLTQKLNYLGHTSTYARSMADGLKTASASEFDLILLDVRLPDGSGLKAIPEFRAMPAQPEIIIITGEGDPDGAELAINTGAWDYIEKPLPMKEVKLQVQRALTYRREKTAHKPARLLKRDRIIGNDPKLNGCLELISQATTTDANVLISGETGTGKELFAKAIHENCNRANERFVVLDCAAFPENLIESILFGHIKGAFTGADQARDGLVKEADKGTLFMDEVGELSISVQKAFLRVLQERCFRPVGGKHEVRSDFRLIAATNRDLDQMVAKGEFRKDLLYRLRSLNVQLPSLRERSGDLECLILHYISRICKQYGLDMKGYSPEFLDILKAYHWPGNVRELVNAIDGAIAKSQHQQVLFPFHLPNHIRINLKRANIGKQDSESVIPPVKSTDDKSLPGLKELLDNTERDYLKSLMIQTHSNIKEACIIAGLSRSGLYVRLKKYHIKSLD